MKIREPYKGHVIEAMSLELRDNTGFVSELFIEKHDGEGVTVTQFFVPGVFETPEKALRATVAAGRHTIDTGYTPTVSFCGGAPHEKWAKARNRYSDTPCAPSKAPRSWSKTPATTPEPPACAHGSSPAVLGVPAGHGIGNQAWPPLSRIIFSQSLIVRASSFCLRTTSASPQDRCCTHFRALRREALSRIEPCGFACDSSRGARQPL